MPCLPWSRGPAAERPSFGGSAVAGGRPSRSGSGYRTDTVTVPVRAGPVPTALATAVPVREPAAARSMGE